MILGFTGTRQGLTGQQLVALNEALDEIPDKLLHGGAEGADTVMDSLAAFRLIGKTEIYPCNGERYRFWIERSDGIMRVVHAPQPPLIRNRIIANRCARLIACPAEATEQLRSGTWATVRYARAAKKPITLILPSGEVREE